MAFEEAAEMRLNLPLENQKFSKASQEAAEKELRASTWLVHGSYAMRETDEGGAYVIASDRTTEEYSPLVSYHGLFLNFARLADGGKITRGAWLEWVESYGVLGLERDDMVRYLLKRYLERGLGLEDLLGELDWLDEQGEEYKPHAGGTEGGPRESHAAFVREVHKARRLLRLYEAATAKDGWGRDRPDVAVIERGAAEEGFTLRDTVPKEAKSWALSWVGHVVQEVISEHCYPVLHQRGDKICRGWGFHTLLGAMYLQMAWLMTATEEIRCKWCGKVISFEQPELWDEGTMRRGYRKPYKPRADKEFCDRGCKDRWHYQNVTKPKKASEA